jgi:hypothetical protein
MALTYDAREVDNWGELVDTDWGKVQEIIFSTIAVGIGSITDETIPEFTARLNMWERIHGYNVTPVTFIQSMKGLKTNAAFKPESRALWIKRIMPATLDNMVYKIEKELDSE